MLQHPQHPAECPPDRKYSNSVGAKGDALTTQKLG
jgi:hypothetical protein